MTTDTTHNDAEAREAERVRLVRREARIVAARAIVSIDKRLGRKTDPHIVERAKEEI